MDLCYNCSRVPRGLLSDVGGEKARDVKINKFLKNHAAIRSV